MQGIPTLYAGVLMRSRLEARWAAFFDLISWDWQYEPLDGSGYIPDFRIEGSWPLLIEVKPAFDAAAYNAPTDKIENGLRGHWEHDVLVLGGNWCAPDMVLDWGEPYPVAGLLGQHFGPDEGAPSSTWAWCATGWVTCADCGRYGVFHTSQSFTIRPCGHYDAGGNLWQPEYLDDCWTEAGNTVRWQRRQTQ